MSGARTGPTVGPVPARRVERPRWTDTRLLLGVLLVLGSVVLGSRVVASAQQSRPVWATVRDLPAGSVLAADDLTAVDVRLDLVSGHYIAVDGRSPVGSALVRPVGAGDLVPAAAVQQADAGPPGHLVSVPVEPLHYPRGLDRGDVVDVYVTPGAASGGATGAASVADPQRVLEQASVVEVDDDGAGFGGAGAGAAVVLAVGDGDVPGLVGAVRSGAVDLVLVGAR